MNPLTWLQILSLIVTVLSEAANLWHQLGWPSPLFIGWPSPLFIGMHVLLILKVAVIWLGQFGTALS